MASLKALMCARAAAAVRDGLAGITSPPPVLLGVQRGHAYARWSGWIQSSTVVHGTVVSTYSVRKTSICASLGMRLSRGAGMEIPYERASSGLPACDVHEPQEGDGAARGTRPTHTPQDGEARRWLCIQALQRRHRLAAEVLSVWGRCGARIVAHSPSRQRRRRAAPRTPHTAHRLAHTYGDDAARHRRAAAT